jgi:hypothetical protein
MVKLQSTKLIGMWKETVIALRVILFRHLHGLGSDKNKRKNSLYTFGSPAQIIIDHSPNTSYNRQCGLYL